MFIPSIYYIFYSFQIGLRLYLVLDGAIDPIIIIYNTQKKRINANRTNPCRGGRGNYIQKSSSAAPLTSPRHGRRSSSWTRHAIHCQVLAGHRHRCWPTTSMRSNQCGCPPATAPVVPENCPRWPDPARCIGNWVHRRAHQPRICDAGDDWHRTCQHDGADAVRSSPRTWCSCVCDKCPSGWRDVHRPWNQGACRAVSCRDTVAVALATACQVGGAVDVWAVAVVVATSQKKYALIACLSGEDYGLLTPLPAAVAGMSMMERDGGVSLRTDGGGRLPM